MGVRQIYMPYVLLVTLYDMGNFYPHMRNQESEKQKCVEDADWLVWLFLEQTFLNFSDSSENHQMLNGMIIRQRSYFHFFPFSCQKLFSIEKVPSYMCIYTSVQSIFLLSS